MDKFIKDSNEVIEIEVNFSNSLNTLETIDTYLVEVYLDNVLQTGIILDDDKTSSSVFVKLSNGVQGQTYVIVTRIDTSDGNVITKNVEMIISNDIPLDEWQQDINTLGDLTEENRIKNELLTKILLEGIIEYTNNEFEAKYQGLEISDYRTLTLLNNTITPDAAFNIPFENGDWIKLEDTKYNNGIYRIKNIVNSILYVEGQLKPETTYAETYLLKFPNEFKLIISDYIAANGANINVKTETLGSAKIEYFFNNSSTFTLNNVATLGKYRKLYRG
jgi:hypothetical protein